jgi:hypothetical protein
MSRLGWGALLPIYLLHSLLSCSPGSGEHSTDAGADFTVLSGWNLKTTQKAEIGKAVASSQLPIRIESAWIKCKEDSLHILLLASNLSKYLSSNSPPQIFLTLDLDTDGDNSTGSRGETSEDLKGFDWSLDFSTMQIQSDSGPGVLNCQVSKWEGDQFSGELSWGTRFNKSMQASSKGDYAEFSVPKQVLPFCPHRGDVRLGFAVPEVVYATASSRIIEYELR